MTDGPLLTEVRVERQTELDDAVRALAWSPGGRFVAVGATGTVTVDTPGRSTTPVGPDPLAVAWLGESRVVIADSIVGAVVIGGGCVRTGKVVTCLAGSGRTVVAGCDDTVLVWHEHDVEPVALASRCGRVRSVAPLTPTVWAVIGSEGLAVVDVVFDVADVCVAVDGAFAVAADREAGMVAVSDVGGLVHLVPLAGAEGATELDGYPDRVRRLGWMSGANPGLVAVADDELTWWSVAGTGEVADVPVSARFHECAITSLAVNASSMALTGDDTGGVRLWSSLVPDRPVWTADLGASVTSAAWSHDGRRVLVGCADGRLTRYRVQPGSIA